MRHALGLAESAISPLLPNGIYTIPEVGNGRRTEESLKKKGVAYIAGRANCRENARGRLIHLRSGAYSWQLFEDPSRQHVSYGSDVSILDSTCCVKIG